MARTPGQRAADEALIVALERVMAAYQLGDRPFVLTEFVILAGSQALDDDGDALNATDIYYRDGHLPLHRALGLVTYAHEILRAEVRSHLEA
jgi:hypothetical protein